MTYIDYDLDVILTLDGRCIIVDQDEYELHKQLYHYSQEVEHKVQSGLKDLLDSIEMKSAPFHPLQVQHYFSKWAENHIEGQV